MSAMARLKDIVEDEAAPKQPSRTSSVHVPRSSPMEVLPKRPSTKGPAELFTGDVWFDVVAAGEEPSRLRVNVVRFAPCARTAGHTHAVGQTMHVTEGVGLVQAKGGEIAVIRPGDTVCTPPDEWHWRGDLVAGRAVPRSGVQGNDRAPQHACPAGHRGAEWLGSTQSTPAFAVRNRAFEPGRQR